MCHTEWWNEIATSPLCRELPGHETQKGLYFRMTDTFFTPYTTPYFSFDPQILSRKFRVESKLQSLAPSEVGIL